MVRISNFRKCSSFKNLHGMRAVFRKVFLERPISCFRAVNGSLEIAARLDSGFTNGSQVPNGSIVHLFS